MEIYSERVFLQSDENIFFFIYRFFIDTLKLKIYLLKAGWTNWRLWKVRLFSARTLLTARGEDILPA